MANNIPLPPHEYQALVCGPSNTDLFLPVGENLTKAMSELGMLDPGNRILDVGCGCARVARHLLPTAISSYHGFDRHPGMIEWSKENVRDPRFTFDCFSLRSFYTVSDNIDGNLVTSEFVWPYPDSSFDSALLASVFTHMPKEDVAHYLRELARVVRPGGRVLFSIFFASNQAEVRGRGLHVLHEPLPFLADFGLLPFRLRIVNLSNPLEPVAQTYDVKPFVHNWFLAERQ